jgi:hypothetical protein
MVLAIIATELSFNPMWRRIIEYVVWIALSIFRDRRALLVSVGSAQLQVRHWFSLGHAPRKSLVGALRAFVSPHANYEACAAYLRTALDLERATPEDVARCYTGKLRAFYFGVLCRNFASLSSALGTAQSQKAGPTRPHPS